MRGSFSLLIILFAVLSTSCGQPTSPGIGSLTSTVVQAGCSASDPGCNHDNCGAQLAKGATAPTTTLHRTCVATTDDGTGTEICSKCAACTVNAGVWNCLDSTCPSGTRYVVDCVKCPAGSGNLNNNCVDILNDKNNCGKVGKVCEIKTAEKCVEGKCISSCKDIWTADRFINDAYCANYSRPYCGIECKDGSHHYTCATNWVCSSYADICGEHEGVNETGDHSWFTHYRGSFFGEVKGGKDFFPACGLSGAF